MKNFRLKTVLLVCIAATIFAAANARAEHEVREPLVQTASCEVLAQFCPIAATLPPTYEPCFLFDSGEQATDTLNQYAVFCENVVIPHDMIHIFPAISLLIDLDRITILDKDNRAITSRPLR